MKKTLQKTIIAISLLFTSKLFIQSTSIIGGALIANNAKAQTQVWESSFPRKNVSLYQQMSPTSIFGNRWNIVYGNKDTLSINHPNIYLDSTRLKEGGNPPQNGKILWLDPITGRLKSSSSASIHVDYNTQVDNKPSSITSNTYNSNSTLLKIGAEPSCTFAVNPAVVMMSATANDSIAVLNSRMNLKTNKALNLTINGVSHDLTVDRSWSITPTSSQVTTAIGYIPLQTEIDGSISNEIQSLSILGQTLSLSGSNNIVIPTQTTALTSSQVTTALSFMPLQTEADGSITNEIQTLSYSSNVLSLTGGGSVNITPTLSASTITTAIGYLPYNSSNPNGYISSYTPTLTVSGNSVGAVGGNTVLIANPILSLSGNSLSIPGSTVTIPTQTSVLTSSQVATALGYTPLQSEIDGSVFNELQSLSISGQSLSISNGNTVILPTQTIALSSAQVTTALGYAPASNTVVSDKTVTLVSSNTLITINGSYPSYSLSLNMLPDYTNTATTTGTAGVAVFYLTSDKTSTGTALYTNITYVNPVVNDLNANYTYGWTISGDKKTLTVSAKSATPTGVIALLGISILGAPVNVSAGTNISVLVKGN